MTVDDVITKTGITLAVIIVFALVTFGVWLVSPGLGMILTLVGAIGGFITVLVSTFGKKYGSAAVTLIYAVFEGLFVGGISIKPGASMENMISDMDGSASVLATIIAAARLNLRYWHLTISYGFD